MRIGFDVTGAMAPASGIGRYTASLYAALAQQDDHSVIPFCNRRNAEPALADSAPLVNPRWPDRLLNTSWRSLGWPPVERFCGPLDVFHTSDWSHPPLRTAARVTTVHDLGPVLHPEWYAPEIADHHGRHNKETVRSADRIITISHFTRETLIDEYSVDPTRVHTVHLGVDAAFSPAGGSEVARARRSLGVEAPYLLFVGTRERRKNLGGLVAAFERVARADTTVHLVIVGARPWLEGAAVHGVDAWSGAEVEERVEQAGLGGRVHVVGAVPPETLIALYSGAEAFVYPTLFEGFGLPALEAMACGCPVVASNRTAVPEVVGDAGVMIDPTDPDVVAEAVLSVIGDSSNAERLRQRGLRRAEQFTWTATARGTTDVYAEAVASR